MKTLLLSSLLLLALPAQAHVRSRSNSDISAALSRAVRYHPAIRAAAMRHSVDPHLLWTIAYLESRFHPRVVSRKGARGLMQFIPATGRRYGLLTLRDLHDPLRSIDAAAKYLRDLNTMFGRRIDLVLAGYNAGENAVVNSRYRVPPYRETRSYVARGILVLKRIAEANIFSSKLPELLMRISETEPILVKRQAIVTRQEARARPQPSRSIYFQLP